MADPASIWRTAYRHPTSWEASYPPLSLPAMLEASAARWPDRPLIDFFGRRFSYAETLSGARRAAVGLAALGVGKGDRVGLFLPNVPHYVAAYYGALMLGATIVNFSPLYTVEELAHQVQDSGTRILVTVSAKALLPTALKVMETSGLERLVVGSVAGALPPAKSLLYRLFQRKEVAKAPHDPRIVPFSRLIANDGALAPVPIDPERDVALLQYTGGTTGVPKGAKLTHQAMTANARQIVAVDPHRDEDDRIIGVLPLFHIFANAAVLNRTVMNGGEIVMLPRFDAAGTLAAIQRTRATAMPGVPTMYQALLDHPKTAGTDFSSLRVCVSGGAPLAAELKARFEGVTGAKLCEGYGLTESGIASANPYEGENRTGTIGQPLPATTFRLVDRDDPRKPAADGEPGEIVIHGPQIMTGYWNRPDADADIFVGGGLRTGDVGLIDADGYIRIVDRLKDMISVGGFKVFPSQIEAILYHHPAVKEALVIGIPDAYHGENPKAFVTLHPGSEAVTGEALRAWLNPQVGKHERVVAVEIRESLPHTLVGKLSRKELVAEERARAEASAKAATPA
ncbi:MULTISPECIES: long-chain-fatty-acid--CoA ligase [Sphingomonas]|uniref:Long-chain fatty acid--CoA ligase n=1 Tax=Edaphosphingomonas fennica TaxID=114404 RepID=A0A2T4HPS0_9SPHN|nr:MULTISPECIES: long-chain fatty acid--CoA ligase [Sphingomonas]AGH50243.1 long-chain-fatty-acid--CoA ligase [Sphingomonas sp. MM-1]PTD17793.1 long-chain fatty acid--CoA ligase [Sphingomonas fennica]